MLVSSQNCARGPHQPRGSEGHRRFRSNGIAVIGDMPEDVAAAIDSLMDIPAELLSHIASILLVDHLPYALSFCAACKTLHSSLQAIRGEAARQRLKLVLSDQRCLPTRWLEVQPDTDGFAWACGSRPLPTSGVSVWDVRIVADFGCVHIGVCDVANSVAWSMMPYNGRLLRSEIGVGRVSSATGALSLHTLPASLPDGHDTQALVDPMGRPTNLTRCANGAVVRVVFDADEGTLSFGWSAPQHPASSPAMPSAMAPSSVSNGEMMRHPQTGIRHPPRVALRGFPPECVMRPWICVPGWCGGRLHAGAWVSHTPTALRWVGGAPSAAGHLALQAAADLPSAPSHGSAASCTPDRFNRSMETMHLDV